MIDFISVLDEAAIQRIIVPLVDTLIPRIRDAFRNTDTSVIATPEDIRQAFPRPAIVPTTDPAQLQLYQLRRNEAKRYAKLFKDVAPSCALTTTMFLVRDADGRNIYSCALNPEPVKSAYCFFRLNCASSLIEFAHQLAQDPNVIQDVGVLGTP